jgi:Ca2+-binding RTX toxin-like protein
MSRAVLEAAKFAKMLAGHGIHTGNAADDVFVATARGETFNGGSGNDTVSYHTSTGGVEVSLLQYAGSQFSGFAQGDVMSSIENVVGSNFADRLEGNSAANILVGLGGNDVIIGGNGDKLYGDSGQDQLFGYVMNGGSIFMDGGTEADTLFVTTAGGRATIETGSGNDQVTVRVNDDHNFSVTITDFQPYFERSGGFVSAAEATRGDQLKLLFTGHGSLEDQAVHHTEVRGNDFAMVFDNADVHGEVVFQDIGDFLNINDFTFRVDIAFADPFLAV